MTGHADGFVEYVEARQRSLRRTAWLLTNDWGLAEDLVQTALARSWPHWTRIRHYDQPEGYVRRVMVNAWVSWNRRSWRGEQPSDALRDGPAPGDIAAEVVLRMTVHAALGSLTDRQRSVVVLRVLDDLPEAQVARILNCSVGNVKSTAARALAKLRDDPGLAGLLDRSESVA